MSKSPRRCNRCSVLFLRFGSNKCDCGCGSCVDCHRFFEEDADAADYYNPDELKAMANEKGRENK